MASWPTAGQHRWILPLYDRVGFYIVVCIEVRRSPTYWFFSVTLKANDGGITTPIGLEMDNWICIVFGKVPYVPNILVINAVDVFMHRFHLSEGLDIS